jgi:hypothetical protein
MRVVGAEEKALGARHFLETDENIRLYIFDQVTQVDRTVGVWKSGRNRQFPSFQGHLFDSKDI